MFNILLLLVIIFLFYMGLPYLLTAICGIGVLKSKAAWGKTAFTFDDGPNPIYTPVLLDLLNRFGVKATFFVVGSKAEKNPELILRMHEEGHLIGIHNYTHRSNWLMLPWTVRGQVEKTADIIENITGTRPIYYRPPWGMMNLFDFFLLKKYLIVHWSLMAQDWKVKGGSDKIRKRILTNIKEGDIILLHDSCDTFGADTDAPKNTIAALHDVLEELSNKGFSFGRIDEMFTKKDENVTILKSEETLKI